MYYVEGIIMMFQYIFSDDFKNLQYIISAMWLASFRICMVLGPSWGDLQHIWYLNQL